VDAQWFERTASLELLKRFYAGTFELESVVDEPWPLDCVRYRHACDVSWNHHLRCEEWRGLVVLECRLTRLSRCPGS
jgi:hypothetical protein